MSENNKTFPKDNPKNASDKPKTTRSGGHGPFGRGGPMAMMKGDKARDFKGTMKKLIAYLGPHKLATLIVIILSMV
jgi:ATP-binding cassette subfamily B protein